MWGLPHFDVDISETETIMREMRAAREAFPDYYIKMLAYDPTYTRQTTAMSFIVNRPAVEKAFKLERTQGPGRVNRYSLTQVEQTAATNRPGTNGGSTSGAPTD
jgi:ribulose-bisphosphate carboxylase small chain